MIYNRKTNHTQRNETNDNTHIDIRKRTKNKSRQTTMQHSGDKNMQRASTGTKSRNTKHKRHKHVYQHTQNKNKFKQQYTNQTHMSNT